jgi:hypothetical protein
VGDLGVDRKIALRSILETQSVHWIQPWRSIKDVDFLKSSAKITLERRTVWVYEVIAVI